SLLSSAIWLTMLSSTAPMLTGSWLSSTEVLSSLGAQELPGPVADVGREREERTEVLPLVMPAHDQVEPTVQEDGDDRLRPAAVAAVGLGQRRWNPALCRHGLHEAPPWSRPPGAATPMVAAIAPGAHTAAGRSAPDRPPARPRPRVPRWVVRRLGNLRRQR